MKTPSLLVLPARAGLSLLLLAAVLAACGSGSSASSGSTGTSTGTGAGATQTSCFDAAARPTSTCALTPKGNVCSLGDANHCVNLAQVEVYADDGKAGVCLHLVYANDCGAEIFADTCIEHQDPGSTMPTWQCWTSSTPGGLTIDVSQCHATGNYFELSTESSGQLDIFEKKCPAPT